MRKLIEKMNPLALLAAGCLVIATAGCQPAADTDVSTDTDLGVDIGESNVTATGEWPAEEAPATLDAIQEAATEKVEEAQEAAADAVEAVQEAATEAVESVQEAASEATETAKETVESAVDALQID